MPAPTGAKSTPPFLLRCSHGAGPARLTGAPSEANHAADCRDRPVLPRTLIPLNRLDASMFRATALWTHPVSGTVGLTSSPQDRERASGCGGHFGGLSGGNSQTSVTPFATPLSTRNAAWPRMTIRSEGPPACPLPPAALDLLRRSSN